MTKRRGLAAAVIGAATICSLTLWPSPGEANQSLSGLCLICGSRGTADAILNVGLFLPFGAGLSLLAGPLWAVVGSAVLSGLIELLQLGLPGRFPTVGDLVWNTLGGGLGAILIVWSPHVLRGMRNPGPAARMLSSGFPVGVFVLVGFLVAPVFPKTEYYGQWTHDLGWLPAYPGRVLTASVGEFAVPDGRLASSGEVRLSLQRGEPIRFSFETSSRTSRRSHLMAIFDRHRTEVFLVMVAGEDLLFQRRSRSAALRLEEPFLRWRGGLGASTGEIASVEIAQGRRRACVTINRDTRCDLQPGVERGWRLLHRFDALPGWSVTLLDIICLLGLSLPMGLFIRSFRDAALLGSLVAVVGCLVSWWSPGMAPHLSVLLCPPLGAAIGAYLRRMGTEPKRLSTWV